jgi:hypothetical protein
MRSGPHRIGTIMIRFVAILAVVVVALVIIWSR